MMWNKIYVYAKFYHKYLNEINGLKDRHTIKINICLWKICILLKKTSLILMDGYLYYLSRHEVDYMGKKFTKRYTL